MTKKVGRKLYKILVDGKSCSGGHLTWSLPTKAKPGDWHAIRGKIIPCSVGLHLTDDPVAWWTPGCQVYEVEAVGVSLIEGDKYVARRVRLLRQIV